MQVRLLNLWNLSYLAHSIGLEVVKCSLKHNFDLHHNPLIPLCNAITFGLKALYDAFTGAVGSSLLQTQKLFFLCKLYVFLLKIRSKRVPGYLVLSELEHSPLLKLFLAISNDATVCKTTLMKSKKRKDIHISTSTFFIAICTWKPLLTYIQPLSFVNIKQAVCSHISFIFKKRNSQ